MLGTADTEEAGAKAIGGVEQLGIPSADPLEPHLSL